MTWLTCGKLGKPSWSIWAFKPRVTPVCTYMHGHAGPCSFEGAK